MNLIDGKHIAKKIERELKHKVAAFTRPPGLAFIIVGNNPASKTYVKMKKKKCQEIGIFSIDHELPESTTESELLSLITSLNRDATIDGILVQLPLPNHLISSKIMESLSPDKDIDGFHPLNMGKLLLGESTPFVPCTPLGIQKLLLHSHISPEGKHVVILGRSNIVGKPLAALLMQKKDGCNATVTIANSQTHDLEKITQTADILVAAIGHPHFVKPYMIRKGCVIIDVGINRVDGKIVGDVDFDLLAPLTSRITPVPGGVGPMTIAMLMNNTVLSYELKN
jgi:methylenetetrahydrofolate dehydrogenase (NADP+)/methenyltetrahydrofolate cyclohydrolase